MGDDGVVLTDRERQALAGLAESIGDPWLARQLAGQDAQPPRPKRHIAEPIVERFSSAAAPGWLGLVLILTGAALAVTTFAFSTVLAALGLVVMGAGLGRLVADRGEVIVRRLTELASRRVPAPEPSRPRTPPAAP